MAMDELEKTVVEHDGTLRAHAEDIKDLKQLTRESISAFNDVAKKMERLIVKLEDAHTPNSCPIGSQVRNAEKMQETNNERLGKLETKIWYASGAIAVIVLIANVIINVKF